MLTYLRIRNLALIEDVEVLPGAGLVVFTGETGAGKSVLLDGLALLCGQRASLDRLRQDTDEARVEGVFELDPASALVRALAKDGLGTGEGDVLVRRSVTERGSRAHLNDRLVTVGALRQFGEQLVEMVGQHESQVLLRPASQLRLLDSFGRLLQQRSQVEDAFAAASESERQLENLRTDDRERAQRADFLRYQIEEIRAAGLSVDEEAELASERQRLRHSEELSLAAREALELLYEREGAVVELIDQAQERLEIIERLDPGAELPAASLQDSRFVVEELARLLQPYRDAIRADPARLATIEDRLAEIDSLRRKYGDSVAEVLAQAATAAAELASLENRDQEIEAIAGELRIALKRYHELAVALTAARENASQELQQRITDELQDLGMKGAEFASQLRSHDGGDASAPGLPPGASRGGYEGVEFLLAANPGEALKPLARVASGGELSRVLLALKLAEVCGGQRGTLVFDEVDAGVGGGAVADRLAERLARLGDTQQVLIVTHLPQIAARAGTHFHVTKEQRGKRTVVRVERLDDDARVEELARMLGGIQATDSVREHARDLLSNRG